MTLLEFLEARRGERVPLVSHPDLTGRRRALWDGSRIHLSPAMHYLMTAGGEEGKKVAAYIQIDEVEPTEQSQFEVRGW